MTFYRLLTNEWPFGDENTDPDELATLITTTEPQPVGDLAPHVPGVMARTVHRALRRDPTERYADWRAMHAALAPRTVPRDWTEQAAHSGHHRCWSERSRNRQAPMAVCCVADGPLFRIEVWRGKNHYGRQPDRIRPARLAAELKRGVSGLGQTRKRASSHARRSATRPSPYLGIKGYSQ